MGTSVLWSLSLAALCTHYHHQSVDMGDDGAEVINLDSEPRDLSPVPGPIFRPLGGRSASHLGYLPYPQSLPTGLGVPIKTRPRNWHRLPPQTARSWTNLPTLEPLGDGVINRARSCAGCSAPFSLQAPAVHVCTFTQWGFPWRQNLGQARQCGTRYHARCIQVGAPFTTCLAKKEGLILPWHAPPPCYICELCMVQAHVDREIYPHGKDLALLMLKQICQIDYMNGPNNIMEIWSLPALSWMV